MQKTCLALIILLTSVLTIKAAAPMHMKFHCEKDTTEINALLQSGIECNLSNPNALMLFYANKLINKPYVAHTLEGKKEMLAINIDQLDCTTYVETLYALTKTTLANRCSWRDFANNLESIRYRNGEMSDYASRLHYISDWVVNNTARGNVNEVTKEIPGCKFLIKTLDFMTQNRDLYPALKDSVEYQKLRNFEIGYRLHRFPYVKKEWLRTKEAYAALKSGDIIAIVTKKEGIDVSHLGIAYKENGTIYFINASSIGKKVRRENDDLFEYLRRNRNSIGIRVIRVTE